MTPTWQAFLEANGARIADGGGAIVGDFGDAGAERAAAAAGAPILADLAHLALLRFDGNDAVAFLHGQLSCNVEALAPGVAHAGAYCTPQGRMLASFLLVRDGAAIRMLVSRSIAAGIAKRLRMFVLRSKVTVSEEDLIILGLAGRADAPPDWARLTDGRAIGCLAESDALALWPELARRARPVGTPCWEWLDIAAGIPFIGSATQDQLVPQMANLDLIGGVSFDKGCYPGQEIVARTRYLGKIKRRMVLANVSSDPAPQPGDAVYGSDLGAQASGTVVSAAPAPTGGYDVLAVLQLSTVETGTAHLRALDGPQLKLRPLPYAIR